MTWTPTTQAAVKEELKNAKLSIEGWAAYASEYFQNKHDLKGDIERIDKALELIRQEEENDKG